MAGKEVARVERESQRRKRDLANIAVKRRGISKEEWLAVAILFAILMVLIVLLLLPFRVYVFNIFKGLQGAAAAVNSNYPQWEARTVLRSALYQFVQRRGYFPDSLSVLTESFPNNYLTAIPQEPTTHSDFVFSSPNGMGGWVYRQPDADSLLLDAVQTACCAHWVMTHCRRQTPQRYQPACDRKTPCQRANN